MSGIIRKLVSKGKSSSVVLPKGVPLSGQTNATNPTSLGSLMQAYQDLEKAESVPHKGKPAKPQELKLTIDQKYVTMGDILGICPYELREIMGAEFKEDQTLIITLLKKFVSAAKLANAVDLKPVHDRLKDVAKKNRDKEHDWRQSCDKVDKDNTAIDNQVKAKRAAFSKAWGDILIDLTQKLSRNPKVSSLGEWDKLMVMAISLTGDKYCVIDKVTNEAQLNFAECKNMPPVTVSKLPTKARAIQQEFEEAKWQSWLSSASVEELMKELWNFDLRDDDDWRREQLEWAITAKTGRVPVRDKWGNLNWHTTYQQAPDFGFDDFLYQDEEEEYRIQCMKDLINSRVALGVNPKSKGKVKSGSGKPTR